MTRRRRGCGSKPRPLPKVGNSKEMTIVERALADGGPCPSLVFTAPAVTRTKTWSNAPRERDNAHQEDQNVYHKGTAKGSAVRSIIVLALAGAGLSGITGAAWANTASASTNPANSASPSASPGYSGTAPAYPSTSPAGSGLPAGSAAGQSHSCAVTVGVATTNTQVPMRLTTVGSGIVGSQHAVTLSAPVSALGTTFPDAATPMSVTGSATLGGQDTGSIPMTGLADSGNGTFAMTGHWMPQTAGMARIYAPHQFAARLRETTSTAVTVACSATTATTTSTQVTVQVTASAAASSAVATSPAVMVSASAASSAGAMPGAPNTGGGGSLHAPNELPLAASGAGAVLAGLAFTGYAVRRRRGVTR